VLTINLIGDSVLLFMSVVDIIYYHCCCCCCCCCCHCSSAVNYSHLKTTKVESEVSSKQELIAVSEKERKVVTDHTSKDVVSSPQMWRFVVAFRGSYMHGLLVLHLRVLVFRILADSSSVSVLTLMFMFILACPCVPQFDTDFCDFTGYFKSGTTKS
jgi:hypothetical protein